MFLSTAPFADFSNAELIQRATEIKGKIEVLQSQLSLLQKIMLSLDSKYKEYLAQPR